MRIALLMILVAFAGCVEEAPQEEAEPTPVEDDEAMPVIDENETMDASFALELMVDGNSSDMPINITLTSDLSEADALNATWSIEVYALNVTEGGEGGEGCSAKIVVDAGSGNCQDAEDGNTTYSYEVVERFDGFSLPAMVNGTYEPGNITIVAQATLGETTVDSMATLVEILNADPCAGHTPQEPFGFSGTNLAPTDSSTTTFSVGPCHTKITATISLGGGDADTDWSMSDPSGKERASAGSAAVRAEDDLVVTGDIQEGDWSITVENWAGAASDYEVTVTFE